MINGMDVIVRTVSIQDAEKLLQMIKQADHETRYMAREPGELDISVEVEEKIIHEMLQKSNGVWYVAVYKGEIIGQCSVQRIREFTRYQHRAILGIVILKKYWGVGIGNILLARAIEWGRTNHFQQLELQVVTKNERALNLYRKYGFLISGILTNALKYSNGEYADEYYMIKRL